MTTRAELRPAAPRAVRDQAQGSNNWLALGLFLFGIGAALIAVLGPLIGGMIEYHASQGAVNQVIGGDVAGLVLVAPVSIAAGILVWRGHVAGSVLALGPAVYGLYMYSQLVLGNDVFRYAGNAERFFLLYLAMFLLAASVAITAWRVLDTAKLPETPRRLSMIYGWFLIAVALFVTGGLHLPGLMDAWRDHPTSTEYLADPALFWLVKFMDLGLAVPALLAVGVGIIRNSAWVGKAKYAAAGWVALLGSSVAGMATMMQATNDPAAAVSNTVAFGLFAAGGLLMAVLIHRPLFSGEGAGERR